MCGRSHIQKSVHRQDDSGIVFLSLRNGIFVSFFYIKKYTIRLSILDILRDVALVSHVWLHVLCVIA